MEQIPLEFYSKSKEGKCLSNFADLVVPFYGTTYKTGEHAFHSIKFTAIAKLAGTSESDRQKLLRQAALVQSADTPLAAKRLGGKGETGLELTEKQQAYWNSISESVQIQISMFKAKNHPIVAQTLELSGNRLLLHQENRANQHTRWGARIKDGTIIGQNLLGKVWMRVRDMCKVLNDGK